MTQKSEIRVGVRELRGNLTHYLNEARRGTSVLVTVRGHVVAELRAPAAEARSARQLGRLKDNVWIADDFDTWPEDIAASFEMPVEP